MLYNTNPMSQLAPFIPQSSFEGVTTAMPNGHAPMTSSVILGNNHPNGFNLNATSKGKGWFGDLMGQGGLGSALSGLASIGQAIAAFQGIGLAKDQMRQQQRQWEKSWDATRKSINEAVDTRGRLKYNGDRQSVQNYNKTYGV